MSVQPDRTAREGGHARPGPGLARRRRTGDAAAAPQHQARTTGRRRGTRGRSGGTGTLPWRALSAGAAVLAAATVVAVLAGGGPDREVAVDASGAQAGPAPRAAAAPSAAGEDGPAASRPAAAPAATAAAPTPQSPAPSPAAEAGERTLTTTQPALERLLAERAALSTTLLRAVLTQDDAAAATAQTALTTSHTDLERVLTPWTGPAVAETVLSDWEAQLTASRAYAEAVRDRDQERADAARADMAASSRALGVVLDRLSDGRVATYVPPQDAAQLRRFVDALAQQDGADAAEAEQWLRARLHREGTALAVGLADAGGAG